MNRILLFIPMYNCEKQIVRVLGQLTDDVCRYLTEVIVVNNRSTDDGEQAVINYLEANNISIPVKLLRNDNNYGLGGSHKVAFQYAINNGFDYVIVLHGDDQGNISNILPYLKNREYEKYDCFLGARFMRKSRLQGYSTFRTVGNYVYNMIFSAGVGRRIYDLGSGLNMYNIKIFQNKFYEKFVDNLMFNCYMLLATVVNGWSVKFFPITWREDDQISNVKMTRQALKTLEIIIKFVFDKKRFISLEHRDKLTEYKYKVIFEVGGSK